MKLTDLGWVFPVADHPDGRRAEISDGFHPAGNPAIRNGQGHRGMDVLWRRHAPGLVALPWQSKWYEVEPHTPALAAGPGKVTVARFLPTGWAVCIDHSDGVETAYHHMSSVLVEVGQFVAAGVPVGIIGSPPSPDAYSLAHLHFDLVTPEGRALHGKPGWTDGAPYMRTWEHLAMTRPTPETYVISLPQCHGGGIVDLCCPQHPATDHPA